MNPSRRVVLASNNPGKLREISALLSAIAIEIVPQAAFGVAEASEPHDTFLENALAKARHASRATGLPALADDSGLCVDALNGEPGVHSAIYAGTAGDRAERDARNNARLLAQLSGDRARDARFCCVMVLVRHARDPLPVVAEGDWRGQIGHAPRGENGFGYDPLFVLPGRGCTSAELRPGEKNAISHRGKALAQLLGRLRDEGWVAAAGR